MILVDTSIWAGHFRQTDPTLMGLLDVGLVLTHPMVTGELACGNLPRRAEVLELLRELPAAPPATDEEALLLIEERRLMGRGIGYVDVHLLASALLAGDASLWTADARLAAAAGSLGVRHG